MRRTLRSALALGLAGAFWIPQAWAERGGRHELPGAKTGSSAQQVTPEQGFGTVSGTVSKIDANKGHLSISNKGRTATLYGTPDQVASFKPGQQVSLDFVDYNGMHWISLDSMAAGGSGGGEASPLTNASGTVTELDKGSGSLTVNGQNYRTRPEYLAEVDRGDTVSLQYGRRGSTNWAFNISSDSSGPGMGGSGNQDEPGPEGESTEPLR